MKPMAKRLVIKALRRNGCSKVSDDGKHEKWQCPCEEHVTAVPRHAEISVGVVRSIQRDIECLPDGWLQ
jgi:predicted RNA binding protein YcfA (HicA-like mRNA interferase family)